MDNNNIKKWIVWGFVIASFLGLLDASYLTAEHYAGGSLKCYIFTGCDTVLNSKYQLLFGIPVSLWGVIFYFGMLFLSLLYIDVRKKILLYLLCLGGLAGIIVTSILVYLQLFVIQAVCTYCMFSALTSTTLFILSIFTINRLKIKPSS